MAAEAHITSVEAVGAFRSRLVVFATGVGRSLDEVNAEVRRMREWIRTDRRFYWQTEVRRRGRKLDEVRQELLAARMSSLREATAAHQNAVTVATRALHEAEEKLRRVKYWQQQFDIVADPLVKRLGGLRTLADHDLPKAVALLANVQRLLEEYTESSRRQGPAALQGETEADAAVEGEAQRAGGER